MACESPHSLPASDEGSDWINRHVCERLKTRRILRHMSQERLARALGTSYQQLQRYESGKSKLPSAMLYRAALALDAPLTYFFENLPATRAEAEGDVDSGQRLDKAALLAVRRIQSLPDGETRQSLLRLIADLARPPGVTEQGGRS